MRAHASLVRELDTELEAAHGLTLSQYAVLKALRCAPEGRLRMADLAEQAHLSRSGMTRLVDRLERQSWLRRRSCSDDARGCYAEITPEGAERVEAAAATHARSVRQRFLDGLSPQDLEHLCRCLGHCKT